MEHYEVMATRPTPVRTARAGVEIGQRRDDDARDAVRLQARRDAPRNERVTGEGLDILARDSLRTAARRDESEDMGHI